MTERTCHACGATLPDTARFCAVCGKTLASTASTEKKANQPQMPVRVDNLQKADVFSALSTNQPLSQVGKVALADHFSTPAMQETDTSVEADATKPISYADIDASWLNIVHLGGGAPTEPIRHDSLVLPVLATQGPLVFPAQDVTQATPFVASPPFPVPPTSYIWQLHKRTNRSGWVTWLIILVLVFMLLATSLIALGQTILVPSIAIQGNTQVASGGQIHLHGNGFISDDTITFMLDNVQPLYYSGTANTIAARSDGTFDITMPVGTNCQPGLHTIQALEGLSLRRAIVSFIVNQVEQTPMLNPTPIAPTASDSQLSAVMPSIVTLGPVDEGSDQTVSAQVTLITVGIEPISWSASWDQDQASWLQLDQTSGEIQAPVSQTITVRVQVGSLNAGTYTATISFSSPQSAQNITLQVIYAVTASN